MKPRLDKLLLLLVGLLILVGLVAVYSSTSIISPEKAGKAAVSQFAFLKKQLFTVLLGVVAMVMAYKVRLDLLRRYAIPLLLFSLVCLLLVFTPMGLSGGGARRWIRIWPSSFQPSELVKLAMVVFLAWYMSLSRYSKDSIGSFLIPIGVMGGFQVIFLMQPDFGAAMSLGLLTLALLFLAGTRLRYLLSLGVLALPLVIKLAMEPYRWKRIAAFLDPWKDPLGSGFQLVQSFIALGSGGLKGTGLGQGRQKLSFLPEAHTDFIFALIGEELGFIGALMVIVLFCALFFRGISIAKKTNDLFAYYLCFGISLMIAIQAVINFAVVTGLAPTKGLPLPFVSYGGSSLIVSMTAVGLLLNAAKNNTATLSPSEWSPEEMNPSYPRYAARETVQQKTASATASRWQKGYGYRKYGRRKLR